jgi:hypothetical protein
MLAYAQSTGLPSFGVYKATRTPQAMLHCLALQTKLPEPAHHKH